MMIIIYITLFSYSLIALYNDHVNVKPKSQKTKYRDKFVTKIKKFIYIVQE